MAETYPPIAEYQTDHDLLVELRTEMRGLRDDLREMKDGIKEKADDHEARIRVLETNQTRILTWGTAALFALGVAEFLVSYWLKK